MSSPPTMRQNVSPTRAYDHSIVLECGLLVGKWPIEYTPASEQGTGRAIGSGGRPFLACNHTLRSVAARCAVLSSQRFADEAQRLPRREMQKPPTISERLHALGAIRTRGLRLRRATLYPAE